MKVNLNYHSEKLVSNGPTKRHVFFLKVLIQHLQTRCDIFGCCDLHCHYNIKQLILYTGCTRRNGQNFGRVFLMLKYTDITQNTYIQS